MQFDELINEGKNVCVYFMRKVLNLISEDLSVHHKNINFFYDTDDLIYKIKNN